MSGNHQNISGQRFGSLTAISLDHTANNGSYWAFQCKCGNTHVARANTVKYIAKRGDPELPSCGCVELARKTKHGYRKAKETHPLYKIYRGMVDRCYNKNTPSFKWYGGIGVTVCKEWLNNPEAFIDWGLKSGWEENLHLDKDILSKKLGKSPHIYSPETCQWVTAKVNVGFATNRTNFGKHPNVKLSQEQVDEILYKYFNGIETNQSELARQYGLKSPSSIGRLISLARAEE